MKFKFGDIEDAFMFVNFRGLGEQSAVVDKASGKIYYHSDYDSDLHEEIPDELWESEDTVTIPTQNELDLGRRLVFDFVLSQIPEDYNRVNNFFHQRGAYARYKDFLDSKGLLDGWHRFEDEAHKRALIDWCADNGIELEPDGRVIAFPGIFPTPIKNLPLAAIPIDGVKAYLSQAETHQIIFMEFEKDADLPEHSHAAQVGFVLEDKIELTIGGISKTYTKGDRYYIPEGVPHSGKIYAGYADVTFFDQPDRYAKM